jgi:hypothetical protein
VKATCPGCGLEFEVQTKRALGTGRSVDPSKPLGRNENEIFKLIVADGGWMTVRGMQAALVAKDIPHRGRKGRGWAYDVVQGPVANLVGRGLVEAVRVPGSPEFKYRAKASASRFHEIAEMVREATRALESEPPMTADEAAVEASG